MMRGDRVTEGTRSKTFERLRSSLAGQGGLVLAMKRKMTSGRKRYLKKERAKKAKPG